MEFPINVIGPVVVGLVFIVMIGIIVIGMCGNNKPPDGTL